MSIPNVILIHGDDKFAMDGYEKELIQSLGDEDISSINLTRLDGRQVQIPAISEACFSMPFLATRRIVILANPLFRFGRESSAGKTETSGGRFQKDKKGKPAESSRQQFIALLENLPETTLLALEIEDSYRKDWETLHQNHWLRKWSAANPGKAEIRTFSLPKPKDMANWIAQQAQKLGGNFTPQAAFCLAAATGNETRIAYQEIIKILTYVDFSRPVQPADVEAAAVSTRQASLFDMVDAIAAGNARSAVTSLHTLLEQTDGHMLLSMVIRQFRLLLQTREIIEEGSRSADRVASELRQHPYVAGKLVEQAARFSLPALEEIFKEFLEIDEAIKSSEITPELALDRFIVEYRRR